MLHLDYGNATLVGLSASQPHHLQSVLNATARLIHRSSLYEHHIDAARPSLVVVSRMHRFQAGCARLLMSVWSSATVSFWLHPAHHWFQTPQSPVVVIFAASDPTYTAVHRWRSYISGGWKLPLEQSAAWHHLNSNADCFSELPQNLTSFPDHFLPSCFWFLVLYIVYSSGLAVLYLGHSK